MLRADTVIMWLVAGLGLVLTIWHIAASQGRRRPPLLAGLLHGAMGIAGFALFLWLLRQPRQVLLSSVHEISQGAIAALAAAALIGIAYPLLAWRRVPFSPAVMILHIVVAMVGFVLFLGWAMVA